jgi:hypothetical protein
MHYVHSFIFPQRIKVCNRMRILHLTMSLKDYISLYIYIYIYIYNLLLLLLFYILYFFEKPCMLSNW